MSDTNQSTKVIQKRKFPLNVDASYYTVLILKKLTGLHLNTLKWSMIDITEDMHAMKEC